MRGAAALLALAVPAAAAPPAPAPTPTLVPDVSQREVDIRYSFTGAELLLFGAIVDSRGGAPDSDIAVVVKGPSQSVLVREKAKLGGVLWANAGATRFRSAPAFYAVASTRPVAGLVDPRTAAIYELGLDSIHLSPVGGDAPVDAWRVLTGFVDLRRRRGLYLEQPGAVTITSGVLYQARITIPPRVPDGRYTAETFLIRRGRVVAAASRDIEVRKQGFERLVADGAQRYPVPYGLLAVLVSVGIGWAASAAFGRRG